MTKQANKIVQAFGIAQYFCDAEHLFLVFYLAYLLWKQFCILCIEVKHHLFYFVNL